MYIVSPRLTTCDPNSAIVGRGVAGVAVGGIVAVGVLVAVSGVTVAVGGKNVADGEIDGSGVLVAVIRTGVLVMIVGVTSTGGGGVHWPSANSPAAISTRPIMIMAK